MTVSEELRQWAESSELADVNEMDFCTWLVYREWSLAGPYLSSVGVIEDHRRTFPLLVPCALED